MITELQFRALAGALAHDHPPGRAFLLIDPDEPALSALLVLGLVADQGREHSRLHLSLQHAGFVVTRMVGAAKGWVLEVMIDGGGDHDDEVRDVLAALLRAAGLKARPLGVRASQT